MTGTGRLGDLETTLPIIITTTTIGPSGPSPLTGAASPRTRDEVMDVVVSKIISLLILTVLSVLCGLLPLRLLIYTPQIFSKNRHPVDSFLCGLRLFSGGIYLATCFLHLLPDTREKMAAVMVNMGSRSTYAVPELLVISGFYAVVFMEQIIKALYVRAEQSNSKRKKRPKRRKMRETIPIFRSTLDDEDGNQGERFEMTDEYGQRRNNRHDDDSDNDVDDDEDDENNVLVDDDDDYNLESETDSDQYSQNSYTCVKEKFQEAEFNQKFEEATTIPRNRMCLSPTIPHPCPYTEIDNMQALKNNTTDLCKVSNGESVIAVHVSSTAPNSIQSPAILMSTNSSPTSKRITSLSSSPPTTAKSSSPSALHISSGTHTYPPSCNSTSTHIFPSTHQESNQFKQKSTLQQNHHGSPQRPVLVLNHQPHNKSSSFIDATDKISHAQNHVYPAHAQITSQTEFNKLPQGNGQYPNIMEPSIQDVTEDKAEFPGNHFENGIGRDNLSMEREPVKPVTDFLCEKDTDSGIFSSKREGDERLQEERRRHLVNSSETSIDRISECACSLQEFQVKQVVDELTHPEPTTSAHFRSIIYIMALAFHGIFEGMALGLQSMKNSVWALCFAIVVHRCVLAFKLGMDLCRGEEKQGTSFLCIGTFTLISALGIIIGILISSGASLYSDVSVPEAILQSLATGTIIYIVFLDILFKDLQGRNDLKRVSCTFVGFSLMAVVFTVTRS